MNINLNREQQAFMDDQKTKSIYPFIENDNQQTQYVQAQQPQGQYSQSQGQYSQPQGQYSQPQTQYSQPQGQYSQPQGQYSQPQGQYSQPQAQYQQPQGQYSQPQGQYSQPQAQYQQPQGQYAQMQQSDPLNSNMVDRAFKSQKVNNFKYSRMPQQSLRQNNNQWMKMFDNNSIEEGTIPMTINSHDYSNYYQQPQPQMQKQPRMQQTRPQYQDSIQQMISQPQVQKEISEKIKKEINNLVENQQIKLNNQNQKYYNSSEEISRLTWAISELSSMIQNQKTCNHLNSKNFNFEERRMDFNNSNYFFESNFFSHELKAKLSILDNLYKNNGISNENFKKVKKDILLKEINDYY